MLDRLIRHRQVLVDGPNPVAEVHLVLGATGVALLGRNEDSEQIQIEQKKQKKDLTGKTTLILPVPGGRWMWCHHQAPRPTSALWCRPAVLEGAAEGSCAVWHSAACSIPLHTCWTSPSCTWNTAEDSAGVRGGRCLQRKSSTNWLIEWGTKIKCVLKTVCSCVCVWAHAQTQCWTRRFVRDGSLLVVNLDRARSQRSTFCPPRGSVRNHSHYTQQ